MIEKSVCKLVESLCDFPLKYKYVTKYTKVGKWENWKNSQQKCSNFFPSYAINENNECKNNFSNLNLEQGMETAHEKAESYGPVDVQKKRFLLKCLECILAVEESLYNPPLPQSTSTTTTITTPTQFVGPLNETFTISKQRRKRSSDSPPTLGPKLRFRPSKLGQPFLDIFTEKIEFPKPAFSRSLSSKFEENSKFSNGHQRVSIYKPPSIRIPHFKSIQTECRFSKNAAF